MMTSVYREVHCWELRGEACFFGAPSFVSFHFVYFNRVMLLTSGFVFTIHKQCSAHTCKLQLQCRGAQKKSSWGISSTRLGSGGTGIIEIDQSIVPD
ncbi:hypothetical protein L2E82_42357 [Cichorium intybus]|uniref:Uncharacterized protein n=1 Tax=Cichorium intybus TaxID=13427 RepID=A0ACB8ZM80_CICIN|nr:hypothetical protein L2E82_42357 [Cichorium intybus]